jgi:predicted nucleic acid-binding protein
MSLPIVLDASAAIDIVLEQNDGGSLLPILEKCSPIMAPSIFAQEVANALYKYVKAGLMPEHMAIERYKEAIELVDEFMDTMDLMPEVLDESCARLHPVYDVLYMVLARRNTATLITRDKKLQMLAGRNRTSILFEFSEEDAAR